MTLVIGHRGACALLPENTMESFRLAFQHTSAIEFDVHASKEGVPVIIHDATLERTTSGRGYVNKTAAKDLLALGVPTLEEMLKEFSTQTLCVEIKERSPEFTRNIMGLIQRYKAENRCIVGSKYFSVSQTMRLEFPTVRRFLSKREFVAHFLNYKTGTLYLEKDPQAVASMPIEACGLAFGNADFIEYLHRQKITVFYWTVNNPIVMKELVKRGADGVITDNPELGIKTLKSLKV